MKKRLKVEMNKMGLEMNFAWIFSILVGAVILFLAIYSATQFIDFSRFRTDTEAAKSLTILFEPLGTGIEEGKLAVIELPQNTRIYNDCDETGSGAAKYFGKQEISLAQESTIGKKWSNPGGGIAIYDKYIFSDSLEEGKTVYAFIKPFEIGFKVADLIFLYTDKYCFVEPPDEIENEINQLKADREINIKLARNTRGCDEGEISVCFKGQGCDINVDGNENEGIVRKNGESLYYINNLIYGAIFADADVYECNVKRLIKRTSSLASIYADKAGLVQKQGCETGLRKDFEFLAELDNLQLIKQQADKINRKNDAAICQVY